MGWPCIGGAGDSQKQTADQRVFLFYISGFILIEGKDGGFGGTREEDGGERRTEEGRHGQQCHDTHTLALLHFLTGQPVVALSLFPMSLYVSEFQPSAAALSTSITSLPMTKY